MADTSTSAPTNYAEWEASGGKDFTMPEAQPEAQEQAETSEVADSSETAAEPEAAEEVPEQEQEEPKEQPPAKQKRTLGSDHAKMLKEVQEMRRERRELQQEVEAMRQQVRQPAPNATQHQQSPQANDDDPPPVLPRLSTWKGTLEEFEEESDKKQKEAQAWTLRQWKKEQQVEAWKSEAERITANYQQRLAGHVRKHPEFMDEIAKTPVNHLMADVVQRVGPELAQLLIENKDEARRICGLQPAAQLFEMGKLAARLNSNGKKPEPEPEEEDPQPVKVPAKLSGSPHSTPAWQKPDRGAKTYAEWSAIGQRMANGRRK